MDLGLLLGVAVEALDGSCEGHKPIVGETIVKLMKIPDDEAGRANSSPSFGLVFYRCDC